MTIFKRIISREIPADIVYEDELSLAFRDVNPQAPIHILLIPKKDIRSLDDLESEDRDLMGHLLLTVKRIAREQGLDNGYRITINCGDEGGQSVDHLHIHILGGRAMMWPPG
ncbi:MAG TPA: histidine triad nucleotide-binding protein [Planctomycetaceae bacterium]|nr:histidine triad nucleotide-binding protein [Planctomycetaceae bacterium]